MSNREELIEESNMNTVRPTRSNPGISGVSAYNETYRGVDGVILPNNLTKVEYDKMMKEKSGDVKIFNVGNECLEKYKQYTRECKKNKVIPITLKDFYEMDVR